MAIERDTCVDRFLIRARMHSTEPAYYTRQSGSYKSTNWKKFGEEVRDFASGLIALGLQSGERVAILGFNRPEWLISCLGAQMANGVSAGVYTACSAEEVAYVVGHAEAPVVVVEDKRRFEKQLLPHLDQLPMIKHVVVMEGKIDHPLAMTFAEMLSLGKKQKEKLLDDRVRKIDANQVATLIYTSGTTGNPKAVMLSHNNIAWTVKTAVSLLSIGRNDSMISYLPLAHIAEQVFTVYVPVSSGMQIYFAESMEKLADNVKEVQPTLFFGVPRVYEKFYEKVKARVADAKGLKGKMLAWARDVSQRVWDVRHDGKTPNPWLSLQYLLAQRLVFAKLKPLLGFGRSRVAVSGAAPISADIVSFFNTLDIPIYEVYGQSEDCGPTSINIPGKAKVGSVGQPFPGVEVKIADDGEILVRGPNVFLGYLKDEAATKEVLANGWLYSGDIGELGHDGFLKITDRKKDLLITSGGKNVSPQNLENMLKQINLVSLAVVIGDKQKYLAALLTPNQETLEQFAKQKGIEAPLPNLVKHRAVIEQIERDIAVINKRLAPVEQIKKFALLEREFSVETGELTPTMKIKRKVISVRYQKEIQGLYQ